MAKLVQWEKVASDLYYGRTDNTPDKDLAVFSITKEGIGSFLLWEGVAETKKAKTICRGSLGVCKAHAEDMIRRRTSMTKEQKLAAIKADTKNGRKMNFSFDGITGTLWAMIPNYLSQDESFAEMVCKAVEKEIEARGGFIAVES